MLPELPFTVGQPYKNFVLQKFQIFGFWFPSSRVCRGSGHAAHLEAVTGPRHQSRAIPAPRCRRPSPWPLRKHLGTPCVPRHHTRRPAPEALSRTAPTNSVSRSRYPEPPRCAALRGPGRRPEPPGAARSRQTGNPACNESGSPSVAPAQEFAHVLWRLPSLTG